MKIGVFQDIHANLPAFKRGVEFFKEQNCASIYHVGDLIGIGPYPKEVMEKACSIKEMKFIMGNHDFWYAQGLPMPIPTFMNAEEVQHHYWTHAQLGSRYRNFIKNWRFTEYLNIGGRISIVFQHYGLDDEKQWFKPHIKFPDSKDLNGLFDNVEAPLIFYGHNHHPSDIEGNSRYVNLGSAGCYDRAEVRLGILEIKNHKVFLQKYSIPYNDNGLLEEFEIRAVPAREFIKKAFIVRHKED